MVRLFFIILLNMVSGYIFAQINTPVLTKSKAQQLIGQMTLEEKASLVIGAGMYHIGEKPETEDINRYISGAAGYTIQLPRLGLRTSVFADGPAGVRIAPHRDGDSIKSYYATAWPIGTLMSSTWDRNRIHDLGVAFGNEVKEYGIDVILAPGMNIHRNPLNGRNFEYFSEDPYLTGHMATSIINGIQSNGVGACPKHFAANNQEANRANVDVIVSERALREIYLRGFQIAVKNSQPWSIMSSYNKINGFYASESYDLLTKILRDEWDFKGFVVTDWYAGRNTIAQMQAGNNLIEPGGERYKNNIIEAVKEGTLDEKVLNKNVEAILNFLAKTPSNHQYKYSDVPDLKAHAKLAREIAAEGMVLLKNEKALPIKQSKSIALFGTASYQTYIGGTGSGEVNEPYNIPINEGLINGGYNLNNKLSNLYQEHIHQDKLLNPQVGIMSLGIPRMIPEPVLSNELIEEIANSTDIAIFTLGRNSGEAADRPVEDNFNLTEYEKDVLSRISNIYQAKRKKMVVLVNAGGVIETESWKNTPDAILLVWQPGQEAGNAVADIISGKVSPSGKLPMTFPIKYEDTPSAKNFPGTPEHRPKEVVYEEGIYVGYRYYNTFDVKVSYPFGHGLSYTSFDYSNLKLNSTNFDNQLKVSVTIKNKGSVEGREVVQLYLSAPSEKVDKPSEELKGFVKTKLLKPGESQIITLELNPEDLASFDASRSTWIADAGRYTVKIGASCEDIKLIKTFNLVNELVVEKTTSSLAPQVHINELNN